METKISIILPSLNVRKYIEECLESIVNQTLYDIEILCIDAGSVDGTMEVIKKYASFDNRIKVIQSDRKSYGYQVNLGIEMAIGEYIGIVDTDDFVSKDMYQILLEAAERNNFPDYVKCNHDMFLEIEGQRLYKTVPVFGTSENYLYDAILSPREWPVLLLKDCYVWKGIYRKSFLNKNEIRMNISKGAAFQDNGFLFQTICMGKRVLYLKDSLYKYRRDNENASVYNLSGFSYIYYEYEFIHQFIIRHPDVNKYFNEMYFRRYYDMLRFRVEVYIRQNIDFIGIKEDIEKIRLNFLNAYEKGELIPDTFRPSQWMEIQIFMRSAESFVNHLKLSITMKNEQIKSWVSRVIERKKVVIFGCGNAGGMAYFLLLKNNVHNIIAWSDNNEALWGLKYMNKNVYSLDTIVNLESKNDITFIIAVIQGKEEVRSQLLKAGILPENIIHYQFGVNPLMVLI